jgi:hypothetical protein
MANHGKAVRTGGKAARHYAKPSRAARYARRWDARRAEMHADLDAWAAHEAACRAYLTRAA